jgi:hypothetical protein
VSVSPPKGAVDLPPWFNECERLLSSASPADYTPVRARVVAAWQDLDRDVWGPLCKCATRAAGLDDAWGSPDNAGALCALVLEAAFRWAIDAKALSKSTRTSAKRLVAIEKELGSTLARASELLAERDRLEQRGLKVEESFRVPDALERLLELAAARFPRWKAVTQPELQAFVRISRNTSKVGPRLHDMLEAAQPPALRRGPVVAQDAAAEEVLLSSPGGAHGGQAERVRQFLAVLRNLGRIADVNPLEIVGPLQWMGPSSIFCLLRTVCPGGLTYAAVQKERVRYMKG